MGGTASGIRAGRAFVEVGTDNNPLSRGLANAQARIAMFGKSVQAVGASLARTGLFAGLPFAASAKQFSSFESAMARIKAIKNPTEEVFKSLGDKAKQLGRDTAYSAAEAAAGMVHFAEAGLTAEQMLHAIGPALDLAAAGNINVAEATETVAKVMKEFKLPASDVVRIVDGLAKASTISLAPVLEMAEGLKKAGPIARELGINLEDTIAILSLLTDSALQGEEAGTALRGMMKSLIAPTDDAQKAMDELGLRVDDGKGNFLGFAAVMGQLEKKLSKLGPTDRMKKLSRIFETRQLTAAASLVGVGGPGIGKQQKEIAGGAGTGARIAKVQLDTLAGTAKILFSSIQGVAIEIGAALSPALRKLGDVLIGVANGISIFITEHKSLVVTLAKGVAITIAAGAAYFAAGIAIQGAAIAFGAMHRAVMISVVAFRAINAVILLFNTAISSTAILSAFSTGIAAIVSPVGLLVIGLTGLTAWLIKTGAASEALSAVGMKFAEMKDSAIASFAAIAEALKAGDIALASQILWATLNVEFLKGVNALNAIWADWGTAVTEVFRGVSYGLSSIMVDLWANIQIAAIDAIGFIQDAWSGLTTFLMKNWNHFGGFFAKVWATIKAKFTGGDVAAEIDRINKETADRDKELGGGPAPDAEREKRKKEIDDARKAAHAELVKMQEEEVERRRREAAAGVAGGDEALKQALLRLEELRRKGKEAGQDEFGDYEEELGPNKRKAAESAIGEGLDKAARTATTKGTFSAAALQGFAAGDTVTDAVKSGVKEQRKTNEQLYRMRRQLEKGGQLV